MNKITVVGRLTNDLEVRTSTSGNSYARFSVASNSKNKDENGDRKVNFFSCFVVGVKAETIAKYAHKGDLIVLSGSMDSARKDNTTYWDLNVDDFEFCGGKKDNNESKELREEVKVNEAELPF